MTMPIQCCAQMQHAVDDPDIPIVWVAKFREIGLRVLDGGDSYIVIAFCPWCGTKLPTSLRAEWFAELERRGIDPYGKGIPPAFENEQWYQNLDNLPQ